MGCNQRRRIAGELFATTVRYQIGHCACARYSVGGAGDRRPELSDIRRDPDHRSAGLLATEAQSRPDAQLMSQRIDLLPHTPRRGLVER